MAPSTFRQTVADVAARAKDRMPASTNGRIDAAMRLVLAHDVTFLDNGTVEVGSASDPLKVHVLTGATCDCADFPRAPESWCKHRLAAGIAKRVQQEIAARAPEVERETEVILPEPMEPYPDNDIEEPPMPPTPAPVPLPEAPASVNVRLIIGGREVPWTLRDTDEGRLAVRLDALLARYPQPPAPAPAPQVPGYTQGPQASLPPASAERRFCPLHGTEMQRNEKDGRSWWSHRKEDGTWCKGR